MTHPPPSYLDPNNVLTAWGSSAAQLGLQVKIRAQTLSLVFSLQICMACLVALLHVFSSNIGIGIDHAWLTGSPSILLMTAAADCRHEHLASGMSTGRPLYNSICLLFHSHVILTQFLSFHKCVDTLHFGWYHAVKALT